MMKQFKEQQIVLVDDDQDDQVLFQDALSILGSTTKLRTFDSGAQFLAWLENCQSLPDILFLDLNMPGMGGLECLKKIRSNTSFNRLLVAIYSTSSYNKDIEKTLECGANVYITKPTDFEKLREIIAKVLTTTRQCGNGIFSIENFLLT